MAKVMVINSVWAALICGMLASTFLLYSTKPDETKMFGPYTLESSRIASIGY